MADAISPSTHPDLYVGGGTGTSSGAQLNQDFTFFLKMLTTQLKNQDPTEPMDVSQMTQQIAQYSGVEQQIKTNTHLEQLLNSNKQSQLSTAVGYIGKEIETDGNVSSLVYAQDGSQTGTAEFSYTLPSGVKSATINIIDASGEVVHSGEGTVVEGKNTVRWNGYSSISKKQLDAGQYRIEVVAKDEAGETISGIATNGSAPLTYAATQYGQAVFSYILPANSQDVKVTVLNASGQAVFQGDGTTRSGRNVVVWDGVNSFSGESMPAGAYTIRVTAKDAKGADINVDARSVGVVDTVETDSKGNIVLNVGETQVKYDEILAVREATPFYVPATANNG